MKIARRTPISSTISISRTASQDVAVNRGAFAIGGIRRASGCTSNASILGVAMAASAGKR
jgi:hypothetical protein